MGRKLLALFLLPVILAFHTAASLAFLAGTRAVERTVCRVFEQVFNGTLVLEHAAIDIFSGLRFENISVTPFGERFPVFTARSIVLECGGSDLLRGRIQPRAVTVVRPVITLKQTTSKTFTFENLIKKDSFGDMVQEQVMPQEKRVSTLIVTDGLIKFEGDGPLPRAVRSVLAPGRQASIEVPVFHWVDAGAPSLKWAFGGIFFHDALGEIQSEGLVDDKGLNRFFLRFETLDLKSKKLLSFLSEGVRRGIERSGFDGEASARFTAERDEEGRLRSHIDFNGFDLFPARYFPLSLRDVTGRLDIEKNLLRIVGTTASASGGVVRLDGTLDHTGDLAWDFVLTGQGVHFTSGLEKALDKIGNGRDYRAFAGRGMADFTFKGHFSRATPKVRSELEIIPDSASASYEGYFDPLTGWKDAFPYRLYDLKGRIHIQPGLVEIRAIEGYSTPRIESEELEQLSSRGRVLIDGKVGTSPSDRHIQLHIVGRDLQLDDRFREAVRMKDPGGADLLDSLNAQGLMDIDVLIDHFKGDGKKPEIQAFFKDLGITYDKFPYPMEHVTGRILIKDGRTILDRIKGFPTEAIPGAGADPDIGTPPGSRAVFVNGILENRRPVQLVIQGFQQPITPRLKEILREYLGEAYGFFCDIEYEGTMDVTVTFERAMDKPAPDFVLDLDLHLDRLSGGEVPVPIEDVRGHIHFDGRTGRLEARDLAFVAGGGRLMLRVLNLYKEEGLLTLDIEGEGRHLNPSCDLTKLWGKKTQDVWNLVGCSGEFDLLGFTFKTKIGEEGRLENIESAMDIRLNGVDLAYPIEITDTYGYLALTVNKNSRTKENVVVVGKSENLSCKLSERLFTTVNTDFVMDGNVLKFSHLEGNFYGGRISGTGENPLHLDLHPPHAFEWRLWAEDADLKYIFGRKDYAFRNVAGRLTGNIRLAGELDNLHRVHAEGDVNVEKGSLFELPLFGDLARLMGNIFLTDPPTFEGGKTAFKFKEGTFQLSDIELISSIMKLNGQGIVSVDGVDLNFIPSTNIVPNIPIIGTVVNLIKEGLFRFRIYGSYSDLNVSYQPIVKRIFTADRVMDEPRYMGRIQFVFTDRF